MSRKSAGNSDPEVQLQRDELACDGVFVVLFFYCVFAPVALWAHFAAGCVRAWRWLHWRRDCCWCNPPHRIGGNPFARRVTHTACTLGQNNFWHRTPAVFGTRPADGPIEESRARSAAASPEPWGKE